jgi:hypothetical protein
VEAETLAFQEELSFKGQSVKQGSNRKQLSGIDFKAHFE